MSEQEEELTPTPRGSPTVQRTLGEPEEHPATSPEGQRHYSEVRSDEEIDSDLNPPTRYLDLYTILLLVSFMFRSAIAQGKRNAKRKADTDKESANSRHELEDGIMYRDLRDKRQRLTGGNRVPELRRRFAAPSPVVVSGSFFDRRLSTEPHRVW